MNGSRIIIDLDRNEQIPVFNGLNGLTSFSFKQGDSVALDLIFVASTGGSGDSLTDVAIEDAVPIVAVGDLEGLPTAGSFRLSYQSQVTGDLDFDSTPAEVQTALNALSTIVSAGGVTVSQLGEGYLIEFNSNGVRDSIVADSTGLVPESGAAIVEAVPGNATTRSRQVVRFVVTPFAYQGTFSALPAPSASLESLIAWNGTEAVTRLVLDNTKTGTIQVTFKKTNGNEYAVAVSADTDEIGLRDAIASLDGLTDQVSVYSSGFRTFDISISHEGFDGSGFVNGLAVDASGCIGYNGFRGTLSLNTVEAEIFLAGSESKQAILEVVLSGDNQRTVLAREATILADLIETSPTTTLELDTPLGKIEAAALYLSKAGNLAGLASVATARTNLGLGTMATETATDYLAKSGNLSGLASVSTARTNLGLGTIATEAASDYLSKAGNLAGLASVSTARSNLGLAPGSTAQLALGFTSVVLQSGFVVSSEAQVAADGASFPNFTIAPSAEFGAVITISGQTWFKEGISPNQATTGVIVTTTGSSGSAYSVTGDQTTGFSVNFNTDDDVQTAVAALNALSSQLSFAAVSGQETQPISFAVGFSTNLFRPVLGLINQDDFVFQRGFGASFRQWWQSQSVTPGAMIVADSNGVPSFSTSTGFALLSGATFTGKVNLPSRTPGGIAFLNLGSVPDNLTVPSTLVEGDIFFHDSDPATGFNVRLTYTAKNFSGTLTNYSVAVLQNQNFFTQPNTISCSHNTQAALRITQLGTGEALRVEDSTNPDATPFVVDANGRVGIGIAPDATAALRLDANGIKFGTNAVVQAVSAVVTASGTYDKEIPVTINGVNYRIPCRQV